MKHSNQHFLVILFGLIIIFVSCTENTHTDDNDTHLENLTVLSEYFNISVDQIEIGKDHYRFNEDRIVSFEEVYKYEEDLLIRKDKDNNKRVRRYAIYPDIPENSFVTYYADATGLDFNETYYFKKTVSFAMRYYNQADMGLNFRSVNSASYADIVLKVQDIGGPLCDGVGTPPTSTAVGSTIKISPGNMNAPYQFVIALIMHEIGHNLGLTHPNDPFGINIPGTGNDPNDSIMLPFDPTCALGNHVSGLTARDIIGLLYLFED